MFFLFIDIIRNSHSTNNKIIPFTSEDNVSNIKLRYLNNDALTGKLL